jgi:hypothetical protein
MMYLPALPAFLLVAEAHLLPLLLLPVPHLAFLLQRAHQEHRLLVSLQPVVGLMLPHWVEGDLHLMYLVEEGLDLMYLAEEGLDLMYLVEEGLDLMYLVEEGLDLMHLVAEGLPRLGEAGLQHQVEGGPSRREEEEGLMDLRREISIDRP